MSWWFIESQLDTGMVIYDTTGGPVFATDEATFENGVSTRNVLRWTALGEWDIGSRDVLKPEMEILKAAFRAARGKAAGFRWKDWADYEVTRAESSLSDAGFGAFQLEKNYFFGIEVETRPIVKPVVGTVTIYVNGAAQACSIDYTQGRVTPSSYTPGDVLEWEGQFDVPVRFLTDKFTARFLAKDGEESAFAVEALPIGELSPQEIWS